MQIAIELPDELGNQLLEQVNVNKFVQEAIKKRLLEDYKQPLLETHLTKDKPENIAWDLGKDLFDKHSSGQSNLSKDRKKIIREKLYVKHRSN